MLFLDFQHEGQRRREQTMLPDTAVNRKRLQKVIDGIESDIANGVFDYEATFNKKLPPKKEPVPSKEEVELGRGQEKQTPSVSDFAELWFAESQVSWRRSYKITQRGALDKYILPFFNDRMVSSITKADVLAFRASLSKVPARKANETLSNRRINSIMKPMC
jgi:integrase